MLRCPQLLLTTCVTLSNFLQRRVSYMYIVIEQPHVLLLLVKTYIINCWWLTALLGCKLKVCSKNTVWKGFGGHIKSCWFEDARKYSVLQSNIHVSWSSWWKNKWKIMGKLAQQQMVAIRLHTSCAICMCVQFHYYTLPFNTLVWQLRYEPISGIAREGAYGASSHPPP